ncbi:hydroxymethylbilane synthase [soil metagenome]
MAVCFRLPYPPLPGGECMTVRTTLHIGARGSRLSLAQATIVLRLLGAAHPELRVDIRVFSTMGDRLLDTPLSLIGGKGVFTEEIEAALLSGEIDLAVHSLKDLPVQQRDGLVIGAVPPRADVSDVLAGRTSDRLADLPHGARVGTSSLRRAAQLKRARPDIEPISIRGNVETRLRKLMDPKEEYDAIVLARAGLERLDLLDIVTEVLSLEVMLPAPGQGALAVQCRNHAGVLTLLEPVNHPPSELATIAERSFLAGLGGGCAAPVAAYGQFDNGILRLRGRVLAHDGEGTIDVESGQCCSSGEEANAFGQSLATLSIERGAAELLKATV